MKTKEEKLALLDETVNHFNLSNRGILTGGTCKYSGVGCAIGRLIPDKELCKKLDNHKEGSGAITIFHLLPESLQEYGRAFLCELQFLHDDIDCWNRDGLSEYGNSRYYQTKTRILAGVI